MNKKIKYVLLICTLCFVFASNAVFAVDSIKNKNIKTESSIGSGSNVKGTITSIEAGSLTISIKRGPKTIVNKVNFDSKTKIQISKDKNLIVKKDKPSKPKSKTKVKEPKASMSDLKVGDMVSVKGDLRNGVISNVVSIRKEIDRKVNIKKLKSN